MTILLSLPNPKPVFIFNPFGHYYNYHPQINHKFFSTKHLQTRNAASSSSSPAAPGVDLNTLQTAIDKVPFSSSQFCNLPYIYICLCFVVRRMYLMQKDSDGVKEALDKLSEAGWAKKWSSQPYVSRRTVSLNLWESDGLHLFIAFLF